MDWVKGIFLLIVVAFWIVSALVKKREPPRGLRAVAAPPRDDDESAPPRRQRSASEVDKFLAEVRRRRESLEGRKPTPAAEQVRQRAKPVVRPVETRQQSPRRLPQPPPLPTPTSARQEPPRRPVHDVVVAELVPEVPGAISAESAIPITTQATILGPVGSSVTMRQTLELLNNRKSLISAMMLQEIMQRPVSQRVGFVPAYRK